MSLSPLAFDPAAARLVLTANACNSILLVVDSSRQCNDVIVAPYQHTDVWPFDKARDCEPML